MADASSLAGGETGQITVDWRIIEDLIRLGSSLENGETYFLWD